jgi:hypothetical protein
LRAFFANTTAMIAQGMPRIPYEKQRTNEQIPVTIDVMAFPLDCGG